MKSSVFWCSLLLGITIFNSKGLCRPSDAEPEYAGDEEEADYGENYDEKPYSGPPPVIRTKPMIISAKVGETVHLPCQVENGDKFVLSWLNDTIPNSRQGMWMNNIRQLGKDDRVNKLEDKSIEIKQVNIYDSGIYVCQLIADPILNVTHTLIVQPPMPPGTKPTITLFKPGQEVTVKKGDLLVLSCEASGNPEPKITWSKNDNKNNEARMQEDGTTLTIDSVTRKNSGIYTCNAHNSIGTDSKAATVHVHYAPEIEMEEDFITTADEISVNMICTVHATPRPKVTWKKDGYPVTPLMQNEKNKYTLHIPTIKPGDFGVYTCEATNKEGHSEGKLTLSGKPKKPALSNMKDASDAKKPQMIWKVMSFSPITEYELMYKTRQEQEWKTKKYGLENQEKNSFFYSIKHAFDNSLPSAEYETKLRVKNKYGWSDMSDVHFFAKDEEGDLSESSLLVESNTTENIIDEDIINSSTIFENNRVFENSISQQLFDVLILKNVEEELLNGLEKSQNISYKLDKQEVDLLIKTFDLISKKYDEEELENDELAREFINMLKTPSEGRIKEKLTMATNSSTIISKPSVESNTTESIIDEDIANTSEIYENATVFEKSRVFENSTVIENSLGQQLFDILTSKNINEHILNGLAKSQNISNKIDKQGVDLLVKTFGIILKKYDKEELKKDELARVFISMLKTPSEGRIKEKLTMATNSSTIISKLMNSTSESADRSSASELRISSVFVTCLLVARLYC